VAIASRKVWVCAFILAAGLAGVARAAGPTAVITVNQVSGPAPLGVTFDASSSSPDSISFLWDFGDGGFSTEQTVSYIYTVAGAYNVQLTVTNAAGLQNTAELLITVTGAGAGPVSSNMNLRLALNSASFKLNLASPNKDQFRLLAAFDTISLPANLHGVPASLSINNLFTIHGTLGVGNGFVSAGSLPAYQLKVSLKMQQLQVSITGANLVSALFPGGSKAASTSGLVPVTIGLTIGAETYLLTENFSYTAVSGVSGKGVFNLNKGIGSISDGFFVISSASALQNLTSTGHFFSFETFLSPPMAQQLSAPPAGSSFIFTFNEAVSVTVPSEQIKFNKGVLSYDQPEQSLSGILHLLINTVTRRMTITTWDLPANANNGGTGLPLTGQYFKSFDFALRVDLSQSGSILQAVTATSMTRKSLDDAFWQTGRHIRP